MTSEVATQDPRAPALLKAVGLDRLAPEQRDLAINIADRYQLDLLLKHLVMIDGRAYVTRDGLLHIAHRSGQLDGIETTEPTLVEDYWRATCSVYRKDMSHPFVYGGRYPVGGSNKRFAPEMATKVAEVAALRRAFDVSAPTAEERWDLEQPEAVVEPAKPTTLAEKVAEAAAALPAIEEGHPLNAHQPFVSHEEVIEAPTEPLFASAPIHDEVRVGMTEDELRKIVAHTRTPRAVVSATARRLFPDATSSADLTDEQRETLWDVIALEADAALEKA